MPSMRWTWNTPAEAGVKIEDLLVSQPDNGEEALEMPKSWSVPDAIDVIVVDSVAALVPKAEIEGDRVIPTWALRPG